jgi:hypothetical protein
MGLYFSSSSLIHKTMATRVRSLVAFSYMSGLLTITNKAEIFYFTKIYDPLLPPSWMYRDFAPAFPQEPGHFLFIRGNKNFAFLPI